MSNTVNIVKKWDRFRSSNSFFVFGLSNSLFVIFLSGKQLFSVDIFNSAFYFQLFYLTFGIFSTWSYGKVVLRRINEKEFLLSSSINLSKISDFLFSHKTQKEVFEPIIAEWHFEFFEDLNKGRTLRAKWTNLRWTYHFLAAMWQKSPIGDLIEFISKITK